MLILFPAESSTSPPFAASPLPFLTIELVFISPTLIFPARALRITFPPLPELPSPSKNARVNIILSFVSILPLREVILISPASLPSTTAEPITPVVISPAASKVIFPPSTLSLLVEEI